MRNVFKKLGAVMLLLMMVAGCGKSEIPSVTLDSNLPKDAGTVLAASAPVVSVEPSESEAKAGNVEITYIDVGQGDSILITSDGESMMIDTGTNASGMKLRKTLRDRKITELEYLVLTHPDADHIGSAPVVLDEVDVKAVLMPEYEKSSQCYIRTMEAMQFQGIKPEQPVPGIEYSLGSCSFKILGPIYMYDDPNDCSIALMLTCGSKNVLFTGDAEFREESDLVDLWAYDLKTDVYKAGHHGSRSSSNENFMEYVQPEFTVISCGTGNDYGHPHAEALQEIQNTGSRLLRTDLQGDITCVCDGETILWSVDPINDFTPGNPSETSKTETATPVTMQPETKTETPSGTTYILNTNSMKFHVPSCESVSKMSEKNKAYSKKSRDELIAEGYSPCGVCKP